MKYLKTFVGLATASLLFAACQSDTYYIKGEAYHLADGSMLYLTDNLNDQNHPMDSMIVLNGRFFSSGVVDTPRICRLYAANDLQNSIIFFTDPGTIYIELLPQADSCRVSGTTINNHWQALNDSVAKYDLRIRSIIEPTNDSINPNLNYIKAEQLYTALSRLIRQTALYNKENALGRFISSHFQGE